METAKRSQIQGASELSYLELLAYLGMTRHLGGWEATDEISRLCHLEKGKSVLDVGCGVGKGACARARRIGCQVVGIDLSPRMVEWAKQRAKDEHITNRVEFRAADAQELPFEDERFDAVITESVLSFVPDKSKALHEFVRVTKPGGFVGLNESGWLKTPVPQVVQDFLSGDLFFGAKLETAEYYQNLLKDSGLQAIVATTHRLSARGDVLDRAKWFGLSGVLTNLYHIVSFALSNSRNRKSLESIFAKQGHLPADLYEYYGYGIFVGRK
jgi:ubiquinone/menaquinone biosynthesis C-methylase UbiE